MSRCSRPNFLALLTLMLLGSPVACLDTVGPDDGPFPEPENPSGRRDLTLFFSSSESGWNTGYSDFGVEEDPKDIQFAVQRTLMPEVTEQTGSALFVSSTNVSDDLFTFLATRVGRLKATTPYAITFEVSLASDAPSGCVGENGAPGEDVFLKVGASRTQPLSITDEVSQRIQFNLDKGNQSVGGADAQVLGDISNESDQCFNTPYRAITRNNLGNPFRTMSDDRGQLWLFVGTESDYRGTTALYYGSVHVVLEPY